MIQNVTTGRSEIFEKVVNRGGTFFRIRFIILKREGRLRGKVLSCEAIETLSGETVETSSAYLPIGSTKQSRPSTAVRFEEIFSPFSALEFFMSQMTRAPSVN